MNDIEIKCAGCGTNFVWDLKQQAFYREKGLVKPKRCKACAQARRAQMGGNNYKTKGQEGPGIWR